MINLTIFAVRCQLEKHAPSDNPAASFDSSGQCQKHADSFITAISRKHRRFFLPRRTVSARTRAALGIAAGTYQHCFFRANYPKESHVR